MQEAMLKMTDQNTILIVDDDPVILANVADVIRIAGYNLFTAKNGLEALQVMQQHIPDLIVADIMMPVMDGYQFYQAVREHLSWMPIPFIFLSAKGEQKDIRHGYSMGADHYLTKPFEPEDLLVAIEARLERVAAIQAAAHHDVESTKRQLLTTFGHELRTPLTYIYGYLGLLQQEAGHLDESEAKEMLDAVNRGVSRLGRLVEDLLLMVRIDSGAAGTELDRYGQNVDLGAEVREAVRELSAEAGRRSVDISIDLPDDLIIFGWAPYVHDIVRRLIDNAIKFSKPGGGHVWIEAEAQEEYAVIKVRDDGIGISPEHQKHLFERLRQFDREIMEQQGLGLGLAIAERLVHLHGGDIRAESQPGEGSAFWVQLPLHKVQT
jgi:two-component system sensor histidine kinase/response regulator